MSSSQTGPVGMEPRGTSGVKESFPVKTVNLKKLRGSNLINSVDEYRKEKQMEEKQSLVKWQCLVRYYRYPIENKSDF